MKQFQKKSLYKRIVTSKIIVAILFILVLFFGHATWDVYLKERESAGYVVNANSQLSKMIDRKELLASEIARLETKEGIEEEIRSKYNVSKPGENVLIIVDKDKPTTTPKQEDTSWWGRFKAWFNK